VKTRIKSKEHNTFYELDGYNKELKLAFEYQGQQHYYYVSYFHKNENSLLKQQIRDEIKLRLCKQIGIQLIVVPYNVDKEDFIHKKLQKLGISSVL
jgi:hypothetical protein